MGSSCWEEEFVVIYLTMGHKFNEYNNMKTLGLDQNGDDKIYALFK